MRRILLGVALMVATGATASAQSFYVSLVKCSILGNPDSVIEGCTVLIDSGQETGADLALAYNNRGGAYNRKALYRKSIADLTKAIEINPGVSAYTNRVFDYHKLGHDEEAFSDFTVVSAALDAGFRKAFEFGREAHVGLECQSMTFGCV